jgi:membrane-bound lytic murein transglycosylase D
MRINSILLFSALLLVSCNEEKKRNHEIDKAMERLLPDSLLGYQEFINQNYKVFAIPLPKNLSFAGDRVPLENIFVRENLDREILVNTYWHSNTLLFQKRAARWFPEIEKILAENNMPDDLKYIAVVESGLDNVRSPAGASGFWQFMTETGNGYDLEINEYVDERYNLQKATQAACKYLKAAHNQFGTWSLAAASYNMGKGGLNNQLIKQKVNSYYELYLNTETSRYVYRILAAKLILSNSENFGFSLRKIDYYRPYRTHSIYVDTPISSLPQFAIDQGTNYATLRHLNPWIRGYELPNSTAKKYEIKLPKGDFQIEPEVDTTESEDYEEEIDSMIERTILDSIKKIKKDTAKTVLI